MKYSIFIPLFLVLFPIVLSAQKTERICGEYIYHAPENITLEQARKTALERAKTAALAEKFGTIVSQDNVTLVKNENGKSDISFISFGGSEVKGEWLEDLDIKFKKPYYDEGSQALIIEVSICGKAREIVGAGVDFSAKVLCNGTEAKYESENFKHGDDIYLLFRSPVDGYLAVYLVNDSQTAFCLLPYMNDPQGKVKIKAGKDYVFFSEKYADSAEKSIVQEYTLTAEKPAEQNFLYIIFSPNEFTKANDSIAESNEWILPRELSFADFQKWLLKNKNRDKDMKVEIKSLMIKR